MATKKTTTSTDSPRVHASLAALRKETPESVEPFQLALEDSKVITFDDLFARDYEDAEFIMRGAVNGNMTPSEVLRRWLSPEDAETLFSRPRTFRDLTAIMQAAMAYYEDVYGEPGEGSASRR